MRTSSFTPPVRVTVIVPTYGDAPYIRWALASAQAQTVREIEICVLCDGSPPQMVEMLHGIAANDYRIRVWVFPKAPRTGEVHRAKVIPETTGKIICYLSHDDLWFPHHVETVERMLRDADFVHTLHVGAGLGEELGLVRYILWADIASRKFRDRMLDTTIFGDYFGLTFGAHTHEAYSRLEEGWTVTPDGVYTDLHMWRKFLRAPWCRCANHPGITGLHFNRPYWANLFTPEEFDRELGRCFARMGDPLFHEEFLNQALQYAFSAKEALASEKEALASEKEALASKLKSVYASKSWRLTGPLRRLREIAEKVGVRIGRLGNR